MTNVIKLKRKNHRVPDGKMIIFYICILSVGFLSFVAGILFGMVGKA